MGHPLLAYSIASAQESGLFDRIIVSTDSEEFREIAIQYGAEVPFLRPPELASSVSLDIHWLTHAYQQLKGYEFDAFALLRPTSPLRTAATIRRAAARLIALPEADSIRAVELVHQHPGKMWTVTGDKLQPFLPQDEMDVPWHARQYQDLPKVYVQNSSLEMARAHVVTRDRSREGKAIAPFFTESHEGLSIDYELDWVLIEHLVSTGAAVLPVPRKLGLT